MERAMRPGRRHGRGLALLALLVTMAVVALGAGAAMTIVSHESQRQREQDLVRIGNLYAKALERYRTASPGSDKSLPRELDDLVLDRRFVGTVRHLRRLYGDPMRPGQPMVVIRNPAGRIVGVRSGSTAPPIRTLSGERFAQVEAGSGTYAGWRFLVREDGK